MDQILTSDPQRPSLRQKGLDDEIDTIVLKCLSKDRERRYQSAGMLAQDLQRYLRGEAIDARRDSSWYVFSKTLRRHRVSLVVVIAFMVTIILGLAISLHQWRRAERELTRANQIKSVLLQVFDTVDPAVAQGQDTTLLRHMMELAEQQLTPDLDALVEADLRNTLGMVYSSLDDLERANSNYTRALELRRGALGDSHPLTADSIHNLGKLRFQERRYEQAFELFEEALVATRRSLGENHPYVYNVMNDMAQTLPLLGDPEAALPLQRAALEGYEAALGDDHPSTLAAMHNMGMLLRKLGRLEDAELYYRRALPGLRRVLGNDDPTTLASINNLGFLMRKLDRPEEAETYYREALSLRQQTLGPDHEATLISINNLAGLLLDTGNVQEAESLLREGEPVARRRWADSGLLGVYLTKLGTALSHNGASAEAENILNEAYESLIANYGLEHRHTLKAVSAIADLYQSWNRREPSDEREALAAEWHARLAQPDTNGDSESR